MGESSFDGLASRCSTALEYMFNFLSSLNASDFLCQFTVSRCLMLLNEGILMLFPQITSVDLILQRSLQLVRAFFECSDTKIFCGEDSHQTRSWNPRGG